MEYKGDIIDWKRESIVFPFMPKKSINKFTSKGKCFLSKQIPILIFGEVRNSHAETTGQGQEAEGEKIKLLFKYGDDLRQDNLVLQFFRIMDEYWMEKNMNMEMRLYKVMETGNKVGYIEFVDKSDVIATMHKWRGLVQGPFKEKCIYEYFK